MSKFLFFNKDVIETIVGYKKSESGVKAIGIWLIGERFFLLKIYLNIKWVEIKLKRIKKKKTFKV